MTNYHEILRLYAQGISQRSIALNCECSRNTVAKVIAGAKEQNVQWPLGSNVSDLELEEKLFPSKLMDNPSRKHPDYEYIDKEMMRNGVTLKLLWNEYCETCRQSQELPLMYSQFCFYYQKTREKKRATMLYPEKTRGTD